MPLNITKPTDPILTETLVITIFGEPGVGKTSTAYSASRPLLLDFDGGAQRAIGRKDCVIISEWPDIADLMIEDLSDYDTIVVDTVGRALEILAAHLIAENPKNKRSNSTELSIQGYGALKGAFARWIGQLRSLKKDVVLLGHAKEEKDGDNTVWRIEAVGSSKDEVLKVSDLLGYMSPGPQLDFNPTDRHSGKNCAGFPVLKIPHPTKNPDWLATIIQQAKDKMNEGQEDAVAAMEAEKRWIGAVADASNAEDLNIVYASVEGEPYANTVRGACGKRAKALGLIVDTVNKKFLDPEPAQAPEPDGDEDPFLGELEAAE